MAQSMRRFWWQVRISGWRFRLTPKRKGYYTKPFTPTEQQQPYTEPFGQTEPKVDDTAFAPDPEPKVDDTAHMTLDEAFSLLGDDESGGYQVVIFTSGGGEPSAAYVTTLDCDESDPAAESEEIDDACRPTGDTGLLLMIAYLLADARERGEAANYASWQALAALIDLQRLSVRPGAFSGVPEEIEQEGRETLRYIFEQAEMAALDLVKKAFLKAYEEALRNGEDGETDTQQPDAPDDTSLERKETDEDDSTAPSPDDSDLAPTWDDEDAETDMERKEDDTQA